MQQESGGAPQLLTPTEAAERLGLKAATLARYRMHGTGPAFIKIGRGSVRYTESELRDFIERQPRFSSTHSEVVAGAER